MTPPPAALAVLRAALVDAHRAHPEDEAQHVVDALAADGWTITPTPDENGPERPAQAIITDR
jgi:hypothetical protein